EQELVVGVFDPTNAGPQPRGKQVVRPRGIFYTPVTGIWQTVWLEPVPESSIAALKVTPDVDAGEVRVEITGRGNLSGLELRVMAAEPGGPQPKLVVSRGSPNKPVVIKFDNWKYWTPEDPQLYLLTVNLFRTEQ